MATLKIAVMGAVQSGKTQLTHELTNDVALDYPSSNRLFVDAPLLMSTLVAHLKAPNLGLLQTALTSHRNFDFTLVCGLDLAPNTAVGADLRAQEAQDATLRALLTSAKLPFAVVYGQGHDRLSAARRALSALSKSSLMARQGQDANPLTHWHSVCENCSDPACERALFTGLLNTPSY
jgi:nicotinamide riboside kinase